MAKVKYFEYGEKELEYLSERDPVLGEAIKQIGYLNTEIFSNMFLAIINAIIGQQISMKAQETIWNRIIERFSPVTPESISTINDNDLQQCGLSFRKVEYIKLVAKSVYDGSLDLDALKDLTDDEVAARLSKIKGVGVWTAEMLMIFSMNRMDVMSISDLAILRGLRMLYHHRKITPKLFAKYKRRYSPYASIASLYLWAIAEGACPEMKDFAPMTDAQKKAKVKKRKKLV